MIETVQGREQHAHGRCRRQQHHGADEAEGEQPQPPVVIAVVDEAHHRLLEPGRRRQAVEETHRQQHPGRDGCLQSPVKHLVIDARQPAPVDGPAETETDEEDTEDQRVGVSAALDDELQPAAPQHLATDGGKAGNEGGPQQGPEGRLAVGPRACRHL